MNVVETLKIKNNPELNETMMAMQIELDAIFGSDFDENDWFD